MFSIISTFTQTAQYCLTDFWTEVGDPRSGRMPLMGTFAWPLVISSFYLLFSLRLGPALMKDRPPLSLKWLLVPYNLAMSALNAAFFLRVFLNYDYGLGLLQFDWKDRGDTSPQAMTTLAWAWLFMASKYVDMLDTVFFVLRKKDSQITGLHVYHHCSVPVLSWIYLRTNVVHVTAYAFCFFNAPVHTIMYAYYGLAALGPHMQPYLWWKRYITQLQLVQFALLFTYGLYFSLRQTEYHWLFSLDIPLQSVLYLYLFTSFYLKTYSQQKEKKVE